MTESADGSLRFVDSYGTWISQAHSPMEAADYTSGSLPKGHGAETFPSITNDEAEGADAEVSTAEALLLAAAVAGPALARPDQQLPADSDAVSSVGIMDDARRWESWGGTGPAPLHDAVAIREVIRDISNRSEDLVSGHNDGAVSTSFADANRVLRFAAFADERQDYIAPLQDALMRVANGWDNASWADVQSDVTDVWELAREYTARF